jgi:hypothetical protein
MAAAFAARGQKVDDPRAMRGTGRENRTGMAQVSSRRFACPSRINKTGGWFYEHASDAAKFHACKKIFLVIPPTEKSGQTRH